MANFSKFAALKGIKTARRAGAEAQVNLAQPRTWNANLSQWGFTKYSDLASQRAADVGIEVINTAVMESVDAYQRELDAMMSGLVERVTWWQKRFVLPTGGTLQPLDEHGNPDPRLPSGYYNVGLPIQGGGDAWGTNRVSRAAMTVREADNYTAMVTSADVDWMARHMLAAIFTNTTWTYDDKEHGDLVVQPIANGDTVTYVRRNGTVSTDNHFLAQTNTVGAGADNPFPAIYTELSEHPSNSGPYVAYIPTNLVSATTALSGFVEVDDPDIRRGTGNDVLLSGGDVGFGNEVLGKVDRLWIVQWDRLPDNYIIAHARGAGPALAMREYPFPELQGLFPEFQDIDGGRHLNKFIRYAGFGALNRLALVVQRVGNGSYAIPTAMTAPLAV